MRPAIKDFLDSLLPRPTTCRIDFDGLDRHLHAIIKGYHAESLNSLERERFLNDDVSTLLGRHRTFENTFEMRLELADEGANVPPTEKERNDLEEVLESIEMLAGMITGEIYRQFGYKLSNETLALGDLVKLRHLGQPSEKTFSDKVRTVFYKIKAEAKPEPPRLKTLKTDKTEEDLKRIFKALQTEGFISPESRLKDWLTAFGRPTPQDSDPFRRIVWIKKNEKRTKQISKKSLLDLLKIMRQDLNNSPENLKKLNSLFEFDAKVKGFVYDDLYRNEPFVSCYHADLEMIVNKGK